MLYRFASRLLVGLLLAGGGHFAVAALSLAAIPASPVGNAGTELHSDAASFHGATSHHFLSQASVAQASGVDDRFKRSRLSDALPLKALCSPAFFSKGQKARLLGLILFPYSHLRSYPKRLL